jgi:hypothetical protein
MALSCPCQATKATMEPTVSEEGQFRCCRRRERKPHALGKLCKPRGRFRPNASPSRSKQHHIALQSSQISHWRIALLHPLPPTAVENGAIASATSLSGWRGAF